jgi:NAD(P)-dependent dehydrogenase (short-subunit alcohol dehydrogenase family)
MATGDRIPCGTSERGRIAVVTGAAKGIGFEAAAVGLERGATVWLVDMDAPVLAAASAVLAREHPEDRIRTFPGDLSHAVTRAGLVERVVARDGGVDVLVNNAGPPTNDPEGRDDFAAGVARSLGSYGALCRAFRPYMAGREHAAVVSVASIAGMVGLGSDWYAAAKAGVIGLTIRLAVEYGPDGIRVNAVAPGVIATPRTSRVSGTPAVRAALERAVPLGRMGVPRDVAEAIWFLAGAAAGYITGATLKIDGGLSCRAAWSGSG